MPQWEYCVVAPAPPGPVVVYVTFYRPTGAERHVYSAKNYDDGAMRLWPQIIAELGLDGWELTAVYMEALYFKRLLPASSPAAGM